jgi:hypothetical protein
VELLRMDVEKFKADLKMKFEEALKTQKPDALVAHLRKQLEESKAQEARIRLTLDDLDAFMTQNRSVEVPLDFAATRAMVTKVRDEEGGRLKSLEAALAGIKDVTVKVNASAADWQGTGLTARAGNLVGTEPSGQWTVGALAGSCGPKGLPGNQYASSSIHKGPHGCLLVRFGETGTAFVAGEAGVARVTGDGGLISARCNDRNCGDNSGTIILRVVLIPLAE